MFRPNKFSPGIFFPRNFFRRKCFRPKFSSAQFFFARKLFRPKIFLADYERPTRRRGEVWGGRAPPLKFTFFESTFAFNVPLLSGQSTTVMAGVSTIGHGRRKPPRRGGGDIRKHYLLQQVTMSKNTVSHAKGHLCWFKVTPHMCRLVGWKL